MRKGISLVALVITIIVLIILTGTVMLTMGKNGIISRAQQAVSANDIAAAQEKVILEMQTIKVNAEVAGKTVVEYLEENEGILNAKGIEYEIAGSSIIFTVDEKVEVVTDLNGKVQSAQAVIGGGTIPSVSEIVVSNIVVVENADGTGTKIEIGTKSSGTVYISFEASVEGGSITGVTYNGAEVGKQGNKYAQSVTANGSYRFVITGTSNGQPVSKTEEVVVNQYEIVLGEAVNASRYGDKINYNVSLAPTSGSQAEGHLGNGWKIFYEDANYIYIIAEDYLHNSLLPTDLNMSTYDSYGSYWASTSNFTSTSSANILSSKAKQFGLGWLTSNPNSGNRNAKATADLFHNAWTTKFGGGIAGLTCTAIGGPTLEMWIKSWNANPGTRAILYSSYDEMGYYVGASNPPTNSHDYNLSTDAGYITEGVSKLYFPHKSSLSNCYRYWFASSSAYDDIGVMMVNFSGYVSNDIYSSTYCALRPVVSILKAEIQISETSSGSKIWNVSKI